MDYNMLDAVIGQVTEENAEEKRKRAERKSPEELEKAERKKKKEQEARSKYKEGNLLVQKYYSRLVEKLFEYLSFKMQYTRKILHYTHEYFRGMDKKTKQQDLNTLFKEHYCGQFSGPSGKYCNKALALK